MRSLTLLLVVAALGVPGRVRADEPAAPEATFTVTAGAGGVDLAEVGAAARTRGPAVEVCYKRRGGVAIAFVAFDPKGKTTKASVGGTGDARLDRCLEKALARAAWPTTKLGGAAVMQISGPNSHADAKRWVE